MNLVELDQALRKLRLSGMADVLETRLRQAQSDKMVPLDLVSALVSDELLRRQDRLFARRHKLARFRDPDRSLDSFDFDFNRKMNRALVYELATARFVAQRETLSSSAHPERERATSPRPSAAPPSSRGIASSTARPTPSSRRSPTPPSTAPARSTSLISRPCPCSSSTTSACASCLTPPPRTCSSWSCAATSALQPC
jgi:IstB-like ATP binding protein